MNISVLLLPHIPTDTFIFLFSSYLFSSAFLFLLFLSLAFMIMCLFMNIFMSEKRIVGFEKSSSELEKLIGGATEMRRERYLNSITKVLDSRKSCRNTKCQAFILTSFFQRRKTR